MEATFVAPPIPVKPRLIWLVHSGCPVLPLLSSQSLSGQLLDETARAWRELGTQYITEYSNSAAPAMVTSASAGLLATDQDVVEDMSVMQNPCAITWMTLKERTSRPLRVFWT